MPQKLLNQLGVYSFAEQQCRVRVAQVVEADGVGKTDLFEQRLEGAMKQIMTIYGSTHP